MILMARLKKSHGQDIKLTIMTWLWPNNDKDDFDDKTEKEPWQRHQVDNYDPIMTPLWPNYDPITTKIWPNYDPIMTQLWPYYDPIMTWSGISRSPLDSCQGGRVQHLMINRVIITYYHHESETKRFLYSSFMIINSIISFDFFYGQTQPWKRKWTFSVLLPLWFEAKITARNLPIKMVQSTKSRIWSSW